MAALSYILTPITVIAIAGCGLMVGLFFVFSFSVMVKAISGEAIASG